METFKTIQFWEKFNKGLLYFFSEDENKWVTTASQLSDKKETRASKIPSLNFLNVSFTPDRNK